MRAQAVADTSDETGLEFRDGVAEQVSLDGGSTRAVVAAAAPPLIGTGLVGLQQQRNPVLKEKANEGRFLPAYHRSDCVKP
jgi:hypothetical protein